MSKPWQKSAHVYSNDFAETGIDIPGTDTYHLMHFPESEFEKEAPMTYVVVDIECTCWDRKVVACPPAHETIEIGAVFLDSVYKKIGEIVLFVMPSENPILTEYCTELTTITQDMIEKHGTTFSHAMHTLKAACRGFENPIFCSWGDFDSKQLKEECEIHRVPFPFNECHNVKKEYMSTYSKPLRSAGLQKAVSALALRFNGTPHRGIDDARMIAEILQKMRAHAQ